MTVFLVMVILLGWLFSVVWQTPEILYFAVVLSFVMNFFAYWQSDKIALAMSGARPASRQSHLELFRVIENLSITAGLPAPRIYIIPGQQINAFATGRNPKHAAVAVTEGALSKLSKNELEGVMAHELSHIGNRDILISSVVVVLSGLIAILADWFLRMSFWGRNSDDNRAGAALLVIGLAAAILAPLAATMVRMAVSRKREFLADVSGALLTRYPEGLASALEKIGREDTPLRHAHNATAHMYISNPFNIDHNPDATRSGLRPERRSWFTKLFMTHPPIEERIKILRGMHL